MSSAEIIAEAKEKANSNLGAAWNQSRDANVLVGEAICAALFCLADVIASDGSAVLGSIVTAIENLDQAVRPL